MHTCTMPAVECLHTSLTAILTADYVLPRTRGLHFPGLAAWNGLSNDLHYITNTELFKNWLETVLFDHTYC